MLKILRFCTPPTLCSKRRNPTSIRYVNVLKLLPHILFQKGAKNKTKQNKVTQYDKVKMSLMYKAQINFLNPLSVNPTKWSNTFKQFVGNMPTNCLSVFDHFVG